MPGEAKIQSCQPSRTFMGVGKMPAMSGLLPAICQMASTTAGTNMPSSVRRRVSNEAFAMWVLPAYFFSSMTIESS